MISTEVQRTLVKSPPELWSELSDPVALSRHLGELGEIRITRVQPEQKVEWEAANASGKVELAPSGWGTKVTLAATLKTPAEPAVEPRHEPTLQPQQQAAAQPELEPAAQPEHELAVEPKRELAAEPRPEAPAPPEHANSPEPQRPVQAEPPAAATNARAQMVREPASGQAREVMPGVKPRRGWFARLLGRRRRATSVELRSPEVIPLATSAPPAAAEIPVSGSQQVDPPRAEPAGVEAPAGEAPAATGPTEHPAAHEARGPSPVEQCEAGRAMAGEAMAGEAMAEEAMAEQTKALLTSVLDRLGAAHHRPFSRA
jgi:hypothetical protein